MLLSVIGLAWPLLMVVVMCGKEGKLLCLIHQTLLEPLRPWIIVDLRASFYIHMEKEKLIWYLGLQNGHNRM